jgi:hypothetical protein
MAVGNELTVVPKVDVRDSNRVCLIIDYVRSDVHNSGRSIWG